jgi:putative hemolysin
MNVKEQVEFQNDKFSFGAKVEFKLTVGRFTIKTLSSSEELRLAFLLRYQVFMIEKLGVAPTHGKDIDEFDLLCDHLGIFDSKSNQMIATCRLNCSLFSKHFYSEQEFDCSVLIRRPETKLEIGRVCVHHEFRKGIVIMLLWRAIAEYMNKVGAKFLFGCGSVSTVDPTEAVIVYRFLEEQNKIRTHYGIKPTEKYRSPEFEKILTVFLRPLSQDERFRAEQLLPSLCRSYFDIGCFAPGPPAFDWEFKCIDFLTILDVSELSPQIRRKLLGSG